MLDQGTVFKVEKDLAWVEFAASSKCASCGACRMAEGKMVLEVEDPVGVKVGDLVEVEISERTLILSYLVVYGIPILCFFGGSALGSLISEAAGIIMSVAFLAAGFLAVRGIDRYLGRRKGYRGRILMVAT